MKLLPYAVLLLLNLSFSTSKKIQHKNDLRNDTTNGSTAAVFSGIDYHFVLRLIYTISEEKVPAHLINIIYNAPEVNNIGTEDIVNLFNLSHLTIQNTLEIVQLINVQVSSVFSINGLDNLLTELNWQFTDFYNSIVSQLGVSGNPIRNALDALGIDSAQFSVGIAFGDPDPYVEFKKGNFTYGNLENATSQLGITVDQLFAIVLNNSLEKLIQIDEQTVVAIFARNGINQHQALNIWHNQSITMENVYSVEKFRNYLTSVENELNMQTTLGAAIDNDTVAINKEIYGIWKNKTGLIDITASAFTTALQTELDGLNPIHDTRTNIVTLKANGTLHPLPVARSNEDLNNCSLVTMVNNNLVLVTVNVTNHGDTLEVPRTATNNVALGTSLVCDDHIYGILRGINQESIILDSFASFLDGPSSGSLISLPFISLLLCFLVVPRVF